MKKNTIKAFTLVEMLIVIVIIGILIASLMPRMQSAQWRARDVARKNDLAQIQTAIITSQQDRGAFPGLNDQNLARKVAADAGATWAAEALTVDKIAYNLQTAGMSAVPGDPNGSNDNFGLWDLNAKWNTENFWKYIYLVAKRNWVKNAWFVLMAKTEVEWWSNWVVCTTWTYNTAASWLSWWYFNSWTDLAKVHMCKSFTKTAGSCESNKDECVYSDTADLRYILLY